MDPGRTPVLRKWVGRFGGQRPSAAEGNTRSRPSRSDASEPSVGPSASPAALGSARSWTADRSVDECGPPPSRIAMLDALLLRGGSARPARGRGARGRRPAGRRLRAPPTRAIRRRHVIDGVRVHRLDVQRHQGAGLRDYLREYLAFFVRAGGRADPAAPAAPVRARPGPHAAGLPRLRRAAPPAGRRPGDPRPARGDAGVLPDALPRSRRAGSRTRSCSSRSGSSIAVATAP